MLERHVFVSTKKFDGKWLLAVCFVRNEVGHRNGNCRCDASDKAKERHHQQR